MNKSLFVISILFVSIVSSGVIAWEERLAECRSLGISASDCPDDDSVLVPPANASIAPVGGSHSSSLRGSSSEGYGTSHVWVLIDFKKVSNSRICYNAYSRLVFEHRGWRSHFDEPNKTMKGCVNGNEYPINVVPAGENYY